MQCYVNGVGLWGPGLGSWVAACRVLAGAEPYRAVDTPFPAPNLLPPTERRRSSAATRVALYVGQEAISGNGVEASALPSVFATTVADSDTIHAICESIARSERDVSPTRFHNSVFNAAAGYWSIGSGSHQASATVCAYDGTFAAGLLESVTQLQAGSSHVLLIAYDIPCPYPLCEARPIAFPFGMALLLSRAPMARCLGRASVVLVEAGAPTPCGEAALERLRLGNPIARALPVLVAAARGAAARSVLEYVSGNDLAVDFEPWG